MTIFRRRHEDQQGQSPEIGDEIRELVHRKIPQVRAESDIGGVSNLNSLAQSIAGPSMLEIENLIAELNELRDHLMNEGHRIEHAIAEYVHMSQAAQAATKSTKIIGEGLAQLKQNAESRRADRASAAVSQRTPAMDGAPRASISEGSPQ
jgi:hypothetical protein